MQSAVGLDPCPGTGVIGMSPVLARAAGIAIALHVGAVIWMATLAPIAA